MTRRRRDEQPAEHAVPAPTHQQFSVTKVVGVGGGGGNAVDRMIRSEIAGVEFIAINSDAQALLRSQAPLKLRIGDKTTHGLGSGADPAVGRRAAEEDLDHIADALRGADMIFITAGMGGGTGTGAAPVVADIAKQVGALTVAVVTRPFAFEGGRRRAVAERGIQELIAKVDTLIVVPNERLLQVVEARASLAFAFAVVDDVVRQGVQGISDLVTIPGLINVDFADVRTIMTDAGSALMGLGTGHGEQRAVDAARDAIASPLLEQSIDGARGVLLTVTGGADLTLWEVSEAAQLVHDAADPEANIIFGAVIDERLEDTVKISVIATGFDPERGAQASPWAQRRWAEGGVPRD